MVDKTDLNDLTFLIPVRLDSVERIENILMVTDFLLSHFETRIHLLEADACNNRLLKRLLPQDVSIRFIEDYDPIFHRTRYINLLTEECSTPYLAVWDTDVIVPPQQIVQAVDRLRSGETQFVYPFKHDFLDTSSILRELYLKTGNLSILETNTGKMKRLYLPNPVGGAFLANRSAYMESGMENETFYGWGREDGDRFNRWKILGYSYERISGPLFHLTHDRGINSTFHATEQSSIKHSEILRIIGMSKKELMKEVQNWYP
ncbi:MAG: galactosyltransferase-related protein [Balneolaceae bacterium]